MRIKNGLRCGGVLKEIRMGSSQFLLQLLHLSLQNGDRSNAPINGVFQTGFRFIGQRIHRVLPLMRLQIVENFSHVARSEDLVNIGKFLRFFRRKVWRKYTL
jgi:hypothetical protein